MRILIINSVREHFSIGKIAYRFCEELNERGHEAILAYGYDYSKTKAEHTVRISNWTEYFFHHVHNAVTGYHSTWAPLPMRRLKKLYEEFKPDIVQLYNVHGYYIDIYKMFDFFAEKKVPIVYGMLDEHPYLGYCVYAYDCDQFKTGCQNCKNIHVRGYLGSWFFNRARNTFLMKQNAYQKNNIRFTGPKWVLERARSSALLKDAKLYEIDEFIDNEVTFIPRDKSIVRDKLGIKDDEILLLNVAPSADPRKGVKDYIDYASKCRNKKIRFVNVGNQEKEDTLPEGYIGVPFVSNQIELAEYYSAADMLFCTSHADTMPNVCLDALSCGTPVMGYNETGVPYVAVEPYGKFFEAKDTDKIQEYIEGLERKSVDMEQGCRDYALSRYTLKTYTEKQLSIYQEIMSNGK